MAVRPAGNNKVCLVHPVITSSRWQALKTASTSAEVVSGLKSSHHTEGKGWWGKCREGFCRTSWLAGALHTLAHGLVYGLQFVIVAWPCFHPWPGKEYLICHIEQCSLTSNHYGDVLSSPHSHRHPVLRFYPRVRLPFPLFLTFQQGQVPWQRLLTATHRGWPPKPWGRSEQSSSISFFSLQSQTPTLKM